MRYTNLPDEKRIVITGMGAATPCGDGVGPLIEAARTGTSALTTVTLDDGWPTSGGRQVAGGPVDPDWLEPYAHADRTTALTLAAAAQVLEPLPETFRRRLALFVATGKPDMRLIERVHRDLLDRGPAAIPPDFIARVTPDAPAAAVAQRFGCRGVRLPLIGACSTGLDGVAMAARFLRAGRGEAALAGSGEASLTPLVVAAFERMGVLAHGEGPPAKAIRPFARDRAGFLIGEGAAVLLLETLASANARGADVLAEVTGWAVIADAHDQARLAPDGHPIARAIRAALDTAGLAPDEIAHINAHGTATKLNDPIETRGIRTAFGKHAPGLRICSTKPITGHLLSASGSVELVITLGAMHSGFAPPTINLERPDPACDLDYTPGNAVPCPIRHALVLNYGFGGHVGALIVSNRTEPGHGLHQ